MNRVYNEMTADEVHRHGGTKIGNFGTGGRTYSKYKTGSTDGSKRDGRRVIASILVIGIMLWFYFSELSLAQTMQCTQQVAEEATPVLPPFAVDPSNNQKLVYAAAPRPAVNAPAPFDTFFGVEFGTDVASARRVTEYCQWQEFEHRTRTKVGTKPNCEAKDDSCNIYREDKSYTYHKAWRTHLVSSLRFDNAAAYHNPTRDPCPAADFHAENGIRLDGTQPQRQGGDATATLTVDPRDAADGLLPWAAVPLHKTTAQRATPQALQAGFHEADHRYIYSRGPRDGWSSPAVKAGMSYLVDGVLDVEQISNGLGVEAALGGAGLDWITKGSCNVGDIRVSFQIKAVGRQGMAVAGQQRYDGVVAPFKCRGKAGGAMLVAYPDGTLSLSEMTRAVAAEAWRWTMVYRAIQGVVCAICLYCVFPGALFDERAAANKALGDGDRMKALFGIGTVWALTWATSYGVDAWTALPIGAMVLAGYYAKQLREGDGAGTDSNTDSSKRD